MTGPRDESDDRPHWGDDHPSVAYPLDALAHAVHPVMASSPITQGRPMTQQPTVPNAQQAPTAQPPPAGRRGLAIWVLGGLALVVVLGVIAAVVGLGRDDDDPAAGVPPAAPASISAAPTTISVRGSIKLGLGDFIWDDGAGQGITGPTCAGDGGYNDIETGASVTVTDASGAVVGLGKLDSSIPVDFSEAKTPTACELKFTVPSVLAGKGFYGIEVTHRGAVKFEESKLAAPVQLTLG